MNFSILICCNFSGIGVADQLFTTGNGYRPDAHHMVVFIVGNQ